MDANTRRSSLLRSSTLLLRRMTHPAGVRSVPAASPAPSLASGLSTRASFARAPSDVGVTGMPPRARAAPTEAGAASNRPLLGRSVSDAHALLARTPPLASIKLVRSASNVSRSLARTNTNASPSLARSISGALNQASQAGRAESAGQVLDQLLEGGMIGKARRASAAWRDMKKQLASLEQRERHQALLGAHSRQRLPPRNPPVPTTSGGDKAGTGSSMQRQPSSRSLLGASGDGAGTLSSSSRAGGGGVSLNSVRPTSTGTHVAFADDGRTAGGSLHTLAEEEPDGHCTGVPGSHAASPFAAVAAPGPRHSEGSEVVDRATAEALIAAFADSEVRRYLQQQLSQAERCCSERRGSSTTSPASAAGLGLAASTSSLTASHSVGDVSAEATAGGDAGGAAAWGRDPMLQAWMVTRTGPDVPVRGWAAPPGRAACRLVAAQEMQTYYQEQKRKQGSYFRWLRLSRRQARERDADTAPAQLLADPDSQLQPRKVTLRGAVRRSIAATLMTGMAQQAKAVAWARQHAEETAAAARAQMQDERNQAAAAEEAHAAAAAAAAPAAAQRARMGDAAGNAFAAVVQQAGVRQAAAQQERKPPPPLPLGKLTQRWHRHAAAAAAAAGEQTARERRDRAARAALKEQWVSVRQRLTAATTPAT